MNRKGTSKGTPGTRGGAASNVDEYLASVPASQRAALEKLRRAIRAAVPDATEVISYRVPTFRHHGGLVAFAAFKDHLSFFVMSPAVMDAHERDLKGYEAAGATIHFTPDAPLPAALVKKLVKARVAENEARRGPATPRRRTAPPARRSGRGRTRGTADR